jgi:hypothetical protein
LKKNSWAGRARQRKTSTQKPEGGNHPSSLPLSPTEIESHIIKQEDILNGKENEIKELQQVISQQKQNFR